MNKKNYTLFFLFIFLLGGNIFTLAQTTYYPKVTIEQSAAQVEKEISTTYSEEDYSGITYIGSNKYAVVSDKKDGFYIFTITLNSNGSINTIARSDLFRNSTVSQDCEGIIYHPERNSVFISREKDQTIREYNLSTGVVTGTQLNVPSIFTSGTGNYGFESLGYNATTGLFWTTTESTLSMDGSQASYSNKINNRLRIQAFGENHQPAGQYAYKMDIPTATATSASQYAFGVPAITALEDGRLLVMEREFYVGDGFAMMSSFVNVKIYLVNPTLGTDVTSEGNLSTVADAKFLPKELLKEFRTTLLGGNIANYEGMCLGPKNIDGSYPLLLINDSQGRYSGVLKDYILPLSLKFTDERSTDSSLGNILVNGTAIEGFSSGTKSYSYNVDCSQLAVSLSAIPTDSKASVSPVGSFIANLVPGDNRFDFVVTAENETTTTYTVNIIRTCSNPEIVTDLKDAFVCEGSSHTFELTTKGDHLTYEWFYGNNRIENANGNKYTIENVQKEHYGVYYVVVRSSQGTGVRVYSKYVTLSVASQLPLNLEFAQCPEIAVIGKTYTVKLGGYSGVTKYSWSYSGDGAYFSPEVGLAGNNETKVTFGIAAVSAGNGTSGTLKVSLEHPCGVREATRSVTVVYPTGVEDVTASAVSVYPNPTSGIVNISGTDANQVIRVMDVAGSQKGNYRTQEGATTIDLTAYPKGTYLIQYNGKIYKVIKN